MIKSIMKNKIKILLQKINLIINFKIIKLINSILMLVMINKKTNLSMNIIIFNNKKLYKKTILINVKITNWTNKILI